MSESPAALPVAQRPIAVRQPSPELTSSPNQMSHFLCAQLH
jgi:hypothetical protein